MRRFSDAKRFLPAKRHELVLLAKWHPGGLTKWHPGGGYAVEMSHPELARRWCTDCRKVRPGHDLDQCQRLQSASGWHNPFDWTVSIALPMRDKRAVLKRERTDIVGGITSAVYT